MMLVVVTTAAIAFTVGLRLGATSQLLARAAAVRSVRECPPDLARTWLGSDAETTASPEPVVRGPRSDRASS